jgi:hypothetical protein
VQRASYAYRNLAGPDGRSCQGAKRTPSPTHGFSCRPVRLQEKPRHVAPLSDVEGKPLGRLSCLAPSVQPTPADLADYSANASQQTELGRVAIVGARKAVMLRAVTGWAGGWRARVRARGGSHRTSGSSIRSSLRLIPTPSSLGISRPANGSRTTDCRPGPLAGGPGCQPCLAKLPSALFLAPRY